MIKFLSITASIFIVSVGFLYYLVNNSNFLPLNTEGGVNVVNIIFFIFLGFLAIFCLLALIIFGIRKLFLKPKETKGNIVLALRQSTLISVGLLVVFLLHIFHIVNFIWGLSLLVVVIASLFVI